MLSAQIQQLKDSILTIGRTLPMAMECHFFRPEDDSRVHLEIIYPDGAVTECAFTKNFPIMKFPLNTLLRETQLEQALRDLVSVVRRSDVENSHGESVDSDEFDSALDAAEQLLGEYWEADETHPANVETSAPAIVFYPAGSLGESVEVA